MHNDKEADVVGHNGGPSMEPAKVKVEAIDAVLHDQRFNQTEALVLIGLIVRSDDDLANAIPSGKALSMYAKLRDTDAVFHALKRLREEHRVIERTARPGQASAYCVLPLHVVDAITAEYDALKERKRNATHPANPGRFGSQPTQVSRVPSSDRYPGEPGGCPPPPTRVKGVPLLRGRPPQPGGSTLCTPSSKAPCLYTDLNKTESSQTQDFLESENLLLVAPGILPAEKPRRVAKAKRERNSRLAADWAPVPELVAWVQQRYAATPAQIHQQAEKFRNFHLGRGSLQADWAATWRTWWLNDYHKIAKRPETLGPLFEAEDQSAKSVWAEFDKAREIDRGGRQ